MYSRIIIFLFILCSSSIDVSSHIMPFETPTKKYLKKYEINHFSSGLDLVDCIYVINLDKRIDKWLRMESLLNELHLNGNRVSGVHGWELTQDQMQELAGPYPIRLKGGHVGCLLSHISVLQDAYERGFEVIWVMEDDLSFEESVKQLSNYIAKLNEIDPDWDVFFTDPDTKYRTGEYMPSLTTDFRPDQKGMPRVYYLYRNYVADDIMRLRQRYGTYSMIISRKGIEKILNYFTHVYLWSAIDIDMHYIPNIREYCVTRDIVSVYLEGPPSDTSSQKN